VALDKRTTGLAMHVAVGMLMLAVLCGLFQVFARFVLKTPSDWTEVLTRFALIWMVYVGAAVALRNGAMVSVDLMHRKLPAAWRGKLDLFIAAMVLSLLGLMLYWGASIAWRVRRGLGHFHGLGLLGHSCGGAVRGDCRAGALARPAAQRA
jgi:TRAP-type C4-dicarboxylate transport system permease small subunit